MVLSSSSAAICKCDSICLNDGLFRGLAAQHISTRILMPSGHVLGIGRRSELLPTPYMIAEESTSLYGISPLSSSHRTTPNDQMSTFSEHGSFLMISGAIHATVPAKVMRVLFSFHSRLVPKSLIFTMFSRPIKTLEEFRVVVSFDTIFFLMIGYAEIMETHFGLFKSL